MWQVWHGEAVIFCLPGFGGELVSVERSDRLRSNTVIVSCYIRPACRLCLHTGLTKEPRLCRDCVLSLWLSDTD